jgi:hypothetical protein
MLERVAHRNGALAIAAHPAGDGAQSPVTRGARGAHAIGRHLTAVGAEPVR